MFIFTLSGMFLLHLINILTFVKIFVFIICCIKIVVNKVWEGFGKWSEYVLLYLNILVDIFLVLKKACFEKVFRSRLLYH